MVQLLHKFSIKASDSSARLLKVIKNPVTDHLPVGCKKYLMSYGAEKIVKAADLVPKDEEPICLIIGAIAKGEFLTQLSLS
jgi:rRNA small subunit pseudouridine methyltransferase Nep1